MTKMTAEQITAKNREAGTFVFKAPGEGRWQDGKNPRFEGAWDEALEYGKRIATQNSEVYVVAKQYVSYASRFPRVEYSTQLALVGPGMIVPPGGEVFAY